MTGVTIAVRVNITDPDGLFDRAVDSYLRDGNAPEDVEDRFGTRDTPRLEQCAIEIMAEADHGGYFEFLD